MRTLDVGKEVGTPEEIRSGLQAVAKLNKAGAKLASPKEGGSKLPHSKVSGSGRMGMHPSLSDIPFDVLGSVKITEIQVMEETIPFIHRSYAE